MADGPGTTGAVGGSAQGHVVSPFKEGSDEKVRGEGLSHGVAFEGAGTFERGDQAHGGGGARLDYYLGKAFTDNLKLDGKAGLGFSSASREFTAPNGEAVTSGYKSIQLRLGAQLRYHMPFLDRLYVAAGLTGKLGTLSTADGETVKLPATCTPIKPGNPSDGNFGRGECEPNAGAREAPSGVGEKAGLMNFDRGSARPTSGITLGLEFPLTIGADILRGTWGSMALQAGPSLNLTKLLPSDGHGFWFTNWGMHGGVLARFGGTDSYVSGTPTTRPDADGDGVPDGDDKCPNTPAGTPVDATGCPEGTEPVESTPGSGTVPLPQGYEF